MRFRLIVLNSNRGEHTMKRRDFLQASALTTTGLGLLPLLKYTPAQAARADTLVVAIGNTINSMDIHRTGTNRPSYQIAVNMYDRLITFGRKTMPDGSFSYDYETIEPELAESWVIAEDGSYVDFTLKKDATFWDGTPVTAEDVKWSYDRAVSVGGFPTVQMKAGELTDPSQFEVLDTLVFRVKLPTPSKLAIPDMAVPVPFIINSKVAKANATEDDPWATEYLHKTPAGSGAFMLEQWRPGEMTVYKRNDNWKGGPLPGVQRVIIREVPSPATRRALVERGDIDINFDLKPKDALELHEAGKLKVTGTPIENCLAALGLNVKMKPFDDVRVRQAIAYSIPYAQIFETAAYQRGVPMWGGESFTPKDISWPQPFPYDTDYDKAKALLTEAGLADGFETTLSLNLGLADWQEPAALLIQEGLAKAGIKATIEKIPGANWRTRALVEKSLPMHMKNFGGWLNFPDYYFFWCYQDGHLFNSMNYRNEEIETLVEGTLRLPVEDPQYTPNVKRMLEIAFEEAPIIPLYQPFLDVVMQPEVEGYEYWFHRQLDARSISKST